MNIKSYLNSWSTWAILNRIVTYSIQVGQRRSVKPEMKTKMKFEAKNPASGR